MAQGGIRPMAVERGAPRSGIRLFLLPHKGAGVDRRFPLVMYATVRPTGPQPERITVDGDDPRGTDVSDTPSAGRPIQYIAHGCDNAHSREPGARLSDLRSDSRFFLL
jgi:hypothetical protein